MKINNLEEKSKDALLECFREVPFLVGKQVNLEPTNGDTPPDIQVALRQEDEVRSIVAQVKNNGEPRYARQ